MKCSIKLLFGTVFFVVWLAGCSNGTTDLGPSKTTTIGEIRLLGKFYTEDQKAGLHNWAGGWEVAPEPKDTRLRLSNIMPNREIKNNTNYGITISGTSSTTMDNFQYGFTIIGVYDIDAWIDLSTAFPAARIPAGNFQITGILTTKGAGVIPVEEGEEPYDDKYNDVESLFNSGSLAFTNRIETVQADDEKVMATLSNVVITITER